MDFGELTIYRTSSLAKLRNNLKKALIFSHVLIELPYWMQRNFHRINIIRDKNTGLVTALCFCRLCLLDGTCEKVSKN